ncbi:MAG: glucose 1-dehydrogenase [Acidobacteria bacterium]|nr:glucose 1-dehydrogenase [Acidobacteriota bacterium]
MAQRFKNQVTIVTGGSAGIGEATCELFAEEGARVVIADIDDTAGAALAVKLKQAGSEALFIHTDIASEDNAQRLIAETVKAFGTVDVLVNNAAAFVLKGVEATVADWMKSLSVNVIGTSLVTKYAVEQMKKNDDGKGRGAIVNLASMSGFIAQPNFLTYSATKAALVQMTKNLALDLAPFNIRVNAVCPGTILTRASHDHMERTGQSLEDFLAEQGPSHLLNRVGQPREVAYPILFLASEEASFITATHLMVDGGYIAR